MEKVDCIVCASPFLVKRSHILRGWGKYCSKICQYNGQRTGAVFNCANCEKQVYRNIKDQKSSKSKKYFCGKSCQTIWRNATLYAGDKHSNWKGGTATYRKILADSGEACICARCKTEDKRIIAVHHKDRNRKNNSVSNLIWLCHNCHYLVHHYLEESEENMVPVA